MSEVDDIFVIGGGINGCGIARDAAGRGYSVHLAEMNDLASGTSSVSSNRSIICFLFRSIRGDRVPDLAL